MSAMHMPDENIIMQMGGWKTERIMKSVYQHTMEDKNKEAERDRKEVKRGYFLGIAMTKTWQKIT